MDINQEVAKFEKQKDRLDDKKSKLVEGFTKKIRLYIQSKVSDNERIESTREALAEQETLNDQAIDEANKLLQEVK